ncbi:MAG: peptidylprolyl isomerase [Sulfurovum sp.]|nr:peptidylprolyl isomerase [Sulfurovum sp.]MCB4744385.1 peptidylprolyl isomerase [Sulfurovum sp.]MCB4746497.1 peptidylprolyl isomerase [Sulfurovum sp.]MCB4749412.1 peptidylprolyl isomerase [Sulfurovum sp.]MCB4750485.1 peptidylprolyl isomerase [Sulfurovum sp.]
MTKFVKVSLFTIAVTVTSIVASDILVTVNGKNITKQDAELFVQAKSPKMHYEQLSKDQKEQVKKILIKGTLLAELAQKEGIKKTPEFKHSMEKVADQVAVDIWIQKLIENTTISDKKAKAFYDKNQAAFMKLGKIHARHILVKSEQEAKDIINQLQGLSKDKLKAKFIELAKSKSQGPSGANGGDLGSFGKKDMVPEFSKAAWNLVVGTITTEPVKTKFGYHVIYLEKRDKVQTKPFETVKEKIIANLKQRDFENKITDITKELMRKAKIVDMSRKSK